MTQDDQPSHKNRNAQVMSDSDINYILLNGAQIALSKLRKASSYEDSLFNYAQIVVYLEVSLSRGAGISDDTRTALEELHSTATREHMGRNKALRKAAD